MSYRFLFFISAICLGNLKSCLNPKTHGKGAEFKMGKLKEGVKEEKNEKKMRNMRNIQRCGRHLSIPRVKLK